MKRRGMRFVGLDVIGDYLTEVNVTSPTCVRELDAQYGLNIAGTLFDASRPACADGGRTCRPAPPPREAQRLGATIALSVLVHALLILGVASP
jgi:hypothetical protein